MAALILNQRLTIADRSQPAGVAAGEVHRVRTVPANLTVDGLSKFDRTEDSGPGGEVNRRTAVIGCQGGIEFTGVGAECVGERLGDPARVGVYECGMTDRIGGCIRRQLVHP